ncbi:hypothetical protein CE91St19_18490 [Odoribacter laneus]|jgi:lipoprotein|uniref:hypothetical protein n=1 Tax=Odoribacter laneus TaxID=626933 RepID=UPI00189BE45C|nr:hypothetical protein [Odoribacter laneus]GKI22447.1 hypothetical protein CE91St19_18490 [Odoribacter laneus]GKI24890.1 hypothetical protein CE91St20_10270 [Odoribacter laneus]
MKKLLFLSVVLFVLCGCSNDEMLKPDQPDDENTLFVPHFYGAALLENPAPGTRGVANTLKIWSKPMAEENLTVKFLNGTERYREFIEEVVKEWEKVAGVRFYFVKDNENALIRIGFDYVPGMMSSWALTGTDHLQVYNQQTEPTVHFAQWRRASDELKRSDVLRAFGQVLGLELEFRHPNFTPGWITDENGNIDETSIRDYWESELGDYISWEELKKIVLDPLQDQTFLISKTDSYDPESVMTWPFYEMIAQNIPLIEFAEDYKTELSVQDKEFIQKLYGSTLGELEPRKNYLRLIEFDYTGTTPKFTLTTTKNTAVIWDLEAKEATNFYLPTDTTTVYKFTATHTFAENKKHRIIIAEILERGQQIPTESTALTKFDLTNGEGADNFDIKLLNKALWYIRIIGGENFTSQDFDFTGYDNLKELYLVGTLDSRVTVENCDNLEVLATSRFIYKPEDVSGPLQTTVLGTSVDNIYLIEGPIAEWPMEDIPFAQWPVSAEPAYSLSDLNGPGVSILNCSSIKEISLENTRINNIDFSGLSNLEYVYLSSTENYLVGGSSGYNAGEYLVTALSTLPNKSDLPTGIIVLRGVTTSTSIYPPDYVEVPIVIDELEQINAQLELKNWTAIWDSGLCPQDPAVPWPGGEE